MANFKIALARTAQFEGGYQCYPDDNGNWTGGKKDEGRLIGTKYGITAPELEAFLGRTATKEDMQHLQPYEAEEIYEANYWKPIWGDKINSQEVANELYDMGVNGGVGTAIKLAHRAAGLPEFTHMTDELLNHLNNKA